MIFATVEVPTLDHSPRLPNPDQKKGSGSLGIRIHSTAEPSKIFQYLDINKYCKGKKEFIKKNVLNGCG
jgi:hypothetical protein